VTTLKASAAVRSKATTSSVTVMDLRARRVLIDQPIIKANEYQTMVDMEAFEQKFERLKQRVRSRLKLDCKQAKDKAYQEGLEQGKRDALANVVQQITSRAQMRDALAAKLSSALLLCMSEGFANGSGSALLRARLKSAAMAADVNERIEIRVAPSAIADAKTVIDELKALRSIDNFSVKADENLAATDALVVSASLSLDLRLSSLLNAMRTHLTEANKDIGTLNSDQPTLDEKVSA
jgi:flagellar biosynthesis/type III secretory pathway protein FliH